MKKTEIKFAPEFEGQDETMWASLPEELVACVNWEDFPYRPQASFKAVHNGEMLFIRYEVAEKFPVRSVNMRDQEPVYEDSCVEFFILDENGIYHNFEFNAKGVCLSAKGKNRQHRRSRTEDEMQKIVRFPSAITKKEGSYHWSLVVGIPFASVGLKRGGSYRANFYKCGDLTEKAHFLSWNAINTAQPDFHCPEYFGCIELQHDESAPEN